MGQRLNVQPRCSPTRGSLLVEPTAAHAHVREEQDDEDDCEDDPGHHFTSNSERVKAFLPSIFGLRPIVPPVWWVRIRRWG
jgi:hypothetical protein